jgi:tetratricopeptide (TPR) repeat protein
MNRWTLAAGALFLAACISTPPPHPRALECNELCTNYINSGDLTRAEVQCDLGLQFSPQYADLWVNKGLIELRRGNEKKAKEHFIKALRFNQEQAQAYNNLGFVYYKEKGYGKAHDAFQRALKVNPDYVEARYNLGLVFKDMGEADKAKKEFRTIIAVSANLADPHAQLGHMAYEEGAYQEAIEHLTHAVQLDPQYADAWAALGMAYSEAGKFAEAKDAFTSCIEADPNNAECRHNVAIVGRKAQLLDPALKEVKESLSGQKTAQGEYQLAREYKTKGLENEEKRAYMRCLKYDSKFAPCHFGLYEIFLGERQEKDAVVACKNFLKFAEAAEYKREFETCERYVNSQSY